MNRIFPLHENVCIEEVYGIKRKNAYPPQNSKTFLLGSNIEMKNKRFYESYKYSWLKRDEISEYERNSFTFKKKDSITENNENVKLMTDSEYLRIRNIIIDLYEEKKEFITLGYTYSKILGSFDKVARIFSFLERQKIINNRNIIKECKAYIEDLNTVGNDEEKDFKKENKKLENILVNEMLQEGISQRNCICSKPAAYCSKDKVFICKDCFDRGNYNNNLSGSDFLKIDEKVLKRVWTKREEIKLLEAIDEFGDDWKKVSEHVGTKSLHDCVLYFITLPIRENNLKNLDFTTSAPFINTPNPIMYLITFICSVVHPTLGSVAAQEAMKGIENNSVNLIEKILMTLKEKAKELIELENEKIKRTSLVLEEALINIITLKTKTYKDLSLSEKKVCQELTELRNKMLADEFE